MREIRTRVIGEDELAMRRVIHIDGENGGLSGEGMVGRFSLSCGFCHEILVDGIASREDNPDLFQVALKCPHCHAHSVLPDEADE